MSTKQVSELEKVFQWEENVLCAPRIPNGALKEVEVCREELMLVAAPTITWTRVVTKKDGRVEIIKEVTDPKSYVDPITTFDNSIKRSEKEICLNGRSIYYNALCEVYRDRDSFDKLGEYAKVEVKNLILKRKEILLRNGLI